MPDEKPVNAETAKVDAWAAAALAAMLVRVRSVCITEYQWMIEELQRVP